MFRPSLPRTRLSAQLMKPMYFLQLYKNIDIILEKWRTGWPRLWLAFDLCRKVYLNRPWLEHNLIASHAAQGGRYTVLFFLELSFQEFRDRVSSLSNWGGNSALTDSAPTPLQVTLGRTNSRLGEIRTKGLLFWESCTNTYHFRHSHSATLTLCSDKGFPS